MKKIFNLLICLFILMISFTVTSCGKSEDVIAVVKYGTHTSLDEIEDAITSELKNNLGDKYKIKCYDCSFDAAIITQTMSQLTGSEVKAIVAIATPVAVVAKSMISNKPVIFAAVSDPVSAGIMENMNIPEANVTGTSDTVDIQKLVDLAYTVDPELTTLGYIYTASEANSLSNLKKLQEYAKVKGYTLIEKTISNSSEITEVANSIKAKIDALIVTDDNNVASSMPVLANILKNNNTPMYCAADSEIKDGGMMGYSISYTTLGKITAQMTVSILNGTSVSEVPVKVFDTSELILYYNSTYLQDSTIVIPQEILDKAIDLK